MIPYIEFVYSGVYDNGRRESSLIQLRAHEEAFMGCSHKKDKVYKPHRIKKNISRNAEFMPPGNLYRLPDDFISPRKVFV